MAAPWLPAWPATRHDPVPDYIGMVTALIPKRLYRRASDAWLELEAWGEGLGYVRQLLEWILQSYAAQNDTEQLLLNRWEETFGLQEAPTLALRQAAIAAGARTRGTGTKALIQSIFGPLFGVPPSEIAFETADMVNDIVPGDLERHKATAGHSMRIYHSLETAHVDRVRADKTIKEVTPAGDVWSAGRFRLFKFTTEGAGFGAVFDA